MKKFIGFSICVLFLFAVFGIAIADDTANHTVTINVSSIDDVNVTGNVTLDITALNTTTTDNTSADLDWSTNQSSRKITVASDIASAYALSVDVSGAITGVGTAPGSAIVIGTTAADFVTAISTGSGSCDLEYNATAEPGDGSSSEVHTVTYTITNS